MELKQALADLIAAQDRYKDLNAQAREAKAEYDRLSVEVLPELMEKTGVDSLSTGDKVVYIREDVYANVDAALRGAFAQQLREIGEDAIISEYVFPQTLTAWAKERLEAGETLPPEINLRRVTRAVPRKK